MVRRNDPRDYWSNREMEKGSIVIPEKFEKLHDPTGIDRR